MANPRGWLPLKMRRRRSWSCTPEISASPKKSWIFWKRRECNSIRKFPGTFGSLGFFQFQDQSLKDGGLVQIRVNISGCLAVSVGTYRLAKVTCGSGSYRHLSRGLEDFGALFWFLLQSLLWSKVRVQSFARRFSVIFDWSAPTGMGMSSNQGLQTFLQKVEHREMIHLIEENRPVLGFLPFQTCAQHVHCEVFTLLLNLRWTNMKVSSTGTTKSHVLLENK